MRNTFLTGLFSFLLISFSGFSQVKSRLVSVDGRMVEVKTSGLEERKLMQPVVIFESGLAEDLSIWDQAFAQVSDYAPVLSYNRAGIGQSDLSSDSISISSRAHELKALLEGMKIDPPYILVGHNWGALISREFAANFSNDVMGLLYLDPITDLDNQEDLTALLTKDGLDGALLSEEYLEFLETRMNRHNPGVQKEVSAFISLLKNNQVDWESKKVEFLKSSVMIGRKADMFPMMGRLSMDSREFYKKLIAGKVDYFEEFLLDKTKTSLVLSSGSMNILPYQEPLLISSNVQNLIFSDVEFQILNAGLKLDADSYGEYLDGLVTYMPKSLITERTYNMLGYSLMRHDQYEQALVLFEKNLERYPQSANVYDSYGDGLLALGKVEEAIPYFEKAIELGTDVSHRDLELFRKNLAKSKEMLASQN
ncbi:alpha/beta fold hydrolase [Algoriphagus pacificus]|uniref:Alpha/beta fold hydrolase n=1 Tax=Algoriphagus pacificus TaxID=2811234 RepID=A0ABS3CIZ7_9BACT|nr:alpha/beta hydrolase [Algoriphagus pacificus]MBN7817083.1 alpha/beta fold hydrolase [Algoriphagus pacificus]